MDAGLENVLADKMAAFSEKYHFLVALGCPHLADWKGKRS